VASSTPAGRRWRSAAAPTPGPRPASATSPTPPTRPPSWPSPPWTRRARAPTAASTGSSFRSRRRPPRPRGGTRAAVTASRSPVAPLRAPARQPAPRGRRVGGTARRRSRPCCGSGTVHATARLPRRRRRGPSSAAA
jgi:hypothetical protein